MVLPELHKKFFGIYFGGVFVLKVNRHSIAFIEFWLGNMAQLPKNVTLWEPKNAEFRLSSNFPSARCLVSNHDVRPRTQYHWRVEQELYGGQRCAAIAGTAAAAACTTYIMTQCFHFRQITKCSLLQQAEVCGGQAARGHTRGPASSSAAAAVWVWNNPGPASVAGLV